MLRLDVPDCVCTKMYVQPSMLEVRAWSSRLGRCGHYVADSTLW